MAFLKNNPFLRSGPIRQAYRAVPAESDDSASEPDLEKRASFGSFSRASSGSYTSSSSRRTSETYYPPPPRRRLVAWARPRLRFRRNYGCVFTLILGSTLVAFVVILWRMSAQSAREVEQGFQNVPVRPHPWEEFSLLERYYGGLKSIVERKDNVPEYPNEKAELEEIANLTESRFDGGREDDGAIKRRDGVSAKGAAVYDPYQLSAEVKECFLDDQDKVRIPKVRIHQGVVKGMPDPLIGSYNVLGIRDDICFDRFGRLAPYGLGYSERQGGNGAGMEGDRSGIEKIWSENVQVDWRNVSWHAAQQRCMAKNSHRFENPSDNITSGKSVKLSRTAVLIRTWHDYDYSEEDLLHLRAMAAELSLGSGGEYEMHFLIHVKDNDLQIWADEATYDNVLNASLPAEFAGMGTLWSERQMGLVYGGLADTMYRELPVHGVYRSAFMPVQYFAHKHPEYQHFWHWEMDVRYIGHYYELIDRVSTWAKQQPRKGLWERNARFYVPSEHGSWDDFQHMVRVQTEHGTSGSWKNGAAVKAVSKLAGTDGADVQGDQQPNINSPVWGPVEGLSPSDVFEAASDPNPSTTAKEDQGVWGAGEDPDLILFSPLFDPQDTDWLLAHDYTGYNTSTSPPPRRASIGTTGRYSRRLLEIMHRETALKRHTMFSEMWAPSAALHHGLKAVYAPHPMYVDRRWPTSYAAAVFNNGRNGAAGGARKSVFSEDMQHNFRGTTWYYNAEFAADLWRRWLGYRVGDHGGEEAEISGEGRMCLPSVLLHPVKQVELVREHGEWDEIAEDDMAAQGDTRNQRVQDEE